MEEKPHKREEAADPEVKETKKKNRKSSNIDILITPDPSSSSSPRTSPQPEGEEGEKKKKVKKRVTPVEDSADSSSSSAGKTKDAHPRGIGGEKKASSTNNLRQEEKKDTLGEPAVIKRPVSMPPPASEGLGDGDKFSPRSSLQIKEVGKVKIAILHNAEKKRLEVVVTRFDELDKAEFGDAPSTYVRLCLLPDDDTKFRSRIQRKTLFPTFDEKYSFYHSLEELKKKQLHLTFWKYDRQAGNQPGGEVHIDLSSMYENARMDNWLPLMKASKYMADPYLSDDEPTIQRKPSIEVSKRKTMVFDLPKTPGQRSIGEIKLTLDHDPDGHTLKVIVFGVKGLAGDKPSDLYVKVYLNPDPRKATKKKTRVERNSSAPVFNETFVYHLDEYFKKIQLKAQTAEISLWQDGGLGKAAVQLGRVEISLNDVFSSSYLSGWFPLFEEVKA